MDNFFPPGFWKTVATVGVVVFFVLGLDLVFGAPAIAFIGKTMNKKFHVDQIVVKMLEHLKAQSDKEFDVDRPLLKGWGRFVMSGLLFGCAACMLVMLIPRLK